MKQESGAFIQEVKVSTIVDRAQRGKMDYEWREKGPWTTERMPAILLGTGAAGDPRQTALAPPLTVEAHLFTFGASCLLSEETEGTLWLGGSFPRIGQEEHTLGQRACSVLCVAHLHRFTQESLVSRGG